MTIGTGVPMLFHTGASVPFLLIYWRFAHFVGDKWFANDYDSPSEPIRQPICCFRNRLQPHSKSPTQFC